MVEANPGEILLGKYRVEEVIGIGGMGRVIKASHLYLQQAVAIKILLPSMAESQSTVARFLREAQSNFKLRSEHIVRVHDVGTMPDGVPFMVMEFLDGYDLNQILRHHGPQMPDAVVDMMLQACEGMAEAHAVGIVHRDIKPSNFFITRRPDGSNLLKILDFGISKTSADPLSELTGTQTVIGTPTYMAPEQMKTARSTDPRSDIWSMGVVMYQLLAGRPPFEAETYAELVIKVGTASPIPFHVQLPPGLADIVLRCLEKEPNARIQNVAELARMLTPYASDPVSAQQSAERSQRILASRGAVPAQMLTGNGSAGLPMTPPALTPKSWNQEASSLSGGVGQVGTKVLRRGRGLVIAGVALLCVLAGIGGFAIATSVKDGRAAHGDQPKAAAGQQQTLTPRTDQPRSDPAPAAAKVEPAKTEPVKTEPAKTEPVKTEPARTDPAKTAKTEPAPAKTDPAKTAKTEPAKTDPAKTDPAKTAKTDPAKTDPAKTDPAKVRHRQSKPKDKTDDLFGDRH